MLKYLLEKEFKQIKRNKFLPRVVIVLPFVALALFPMVANFDIKNINLAVVDNNHSTFSGRLIQKIVSSGHFRLTNVSENYAQALTSVEQNEADIVLVIPPDFEKNLINNQNTDVLVSANSVNGIKGGLGSGYLVTILNDFSTELREKYMSGNNLRGNVPTVEIIPRYNFNPYLEYKYTMVPAILMMMLAMLTGFLPALNIVGEKEKGTIEQMNVTPVSKFSLILSKLIPYWVIGFIVLTICFFVAWLFYRLVSKGGYFEIYVFAAVFVLAFSGFGLVISNFANTVQQGMFMMFFFVITFIFLSGLYTPVSSMPDWLQVFSRFSPLKYMVEVLRSIFLKGSSFLDLKWHFAALCGFAIFFNSLAILSYRKSH
ncbi:MAG TPA: ABC transporter permease [Paludibacter sp.]|nr:ABC transporter permease [Paludibacter sp.]